MAFRVWDTSNDNLIIGAYRTRAEATAKAAQSANYTADTTDQTLPRSFRPGNSYRAADGSTVSELPSAVVSERREVLKDLLRALEAVDGLQSWASNDDGERARSYSRWVQMMAIASSIDANLIDDAIYALILREASHDGRTWYWLHYLTGTQGTSGAGAAWRSFLSTDSTAPATIRIWYSTVGPDAETESGRTTSVAPNSRGGILAQNIDADVGTPSMAAAADFNWISYLAS